MSIVRIAAVVVLGAAAILFGFGPAAAEKRVALVIGNGAYQKVGKLANPTNDAIAIADMLKAAGFEEVELYQDLGFRDLRKAIGDFSDLARDADTAIVYYSGHGIEVDGVNYLIPIDAVLDRDIDVQYEAYSLDTLLKSLEQAKHLRLVMLDACRDNPFVRTMKRSGRAARDRARTRRGGTDEREYADRFCRQGGFLRARWRGWQQSLR